MYDPLFGTVHLFNIGQLCTMLDASHHGERVSNTVQYNDSVESIPFFPEQIIALINMMLSMILGEEK